MKKYPFIVRVINPDKVTYQWCEIRHWTIMNARIQLFIQRRKLPKIEYGLYVKKLNSPLGEVRLFFHEIEFLAA